MCEWLSEWIVCVLPHIKYNKHDFELGNFCVHVNQLYIILSLLEIDVCRAWEQKWLNDWKIHVWMCRNNKKIIWIIKFFVLDLVFLSVKNFAK